MAQQYPLSSLLNVRLFREERAKRDVRLAQMALQGARETLRESELRHESWLIEKVKETDRRYERLLGTSVTIDELDRFNRGLAALDDHTLVLVQAVHDAGEAVKECERRVDISNQTAKIARQSTAKIEKHREIWRQEAKKEIERAEEREFEDFTPMKSMADDN